MRRASTFTAAALAASGLLALADAASAQSAPEAGEARGLRYLSWPGHGETVDPAVRQATPPAPARADLRRPNKVIPHGGFATASPPPRGLTPAPESARRTLTPANAWLRPRAPAPEPAPTPVAAPPSPPAVADASRPAGPEYLPDQGGRAQPAPAAIVYATPVRPDEVPPAAAASDPMAPRRDAPIFRLQRTSPPPPPATPDADPRDEEPAAPHQVAEVANSGERPPLQGARYYSVHRQNGRDPDPLVMPAPTYVDALVVSMTDMPVSQDLAAPEQGPTLIRDSNGNMRAAPAASDGDHQ